jgi:hypothetical protein
MRLLRLTFPLVAALCAGALARADDDLLPPDRPVEQAVDFYIDAQLKEKKVTPAPQADDHNLVRRLTLDLVGRIPTAAEVQAHVQAAEPDKRVRLVDRLLASSGFVRHQAAELEAMLMPGYRSNLREYLTRAVADNRPWDQVFRELLLPDETDPKRKGAGDFLRMRIADQDKLTADVSALFFGVNVSCARCHDHPKVEDWKQDHFFGMKSFFSRSFDAGGFLGERDYGLVKFKTTKGAERQAKLMFLTGTVIDAPNMREPTGEEQKKEKELLEKAKKDRTPPPAPKFSARAKLVEVALQPGERDYFARAIVNRLWYRFFGHGLVMPLDQMHSANPPSHPELLDWLARDLVEHGYDLRRLERGLVLSQAYSRTSRWEGETVPRPYLFAVARVRPLSPPQLAASLRLATTDPATLQAPLKPEEIEKRIEALEAGARGLADLFEQPREDFQIGVGEALVFSNSDRIQRELLADGGDRLIGRLKEMKDPHQVIDTAVRAVLSRPPTAEEVKALGEYLAKREDRRVEACRQMLWALLASSEFRFNY